MIYLGTISSCLYRNSSSLPPTWASPSIYPQPAGNPNTHSHGPECGRITALSVTQDVVWVTLDARLTGTSSLLVNVGVESAPDSGAGGWCHGENAPVGAKVLNAPDYAHDDGGEGEDCAITGADEGRDYGEAGVVVLDPTRGEE